MSKIPSTMMRPGASILLAAAVAALAKALFNFFWSGNGIHGTAGALLVVISSALMAAAACALLAGRIGPALRGTLLALIVLDIVGTALSAYFLEANWLIAAMVVALVGWIVVLASDRMPPQPLSGSGNGVIQRGAQ